MDEKTVADLVAEDGVRKVQVEVVHKTEGGSKATIWTLSMVIVLGLAVGSWFVMSGSIDAALVGGDGGGGNCGDGIDNDGGGQADRDDPDCYENPEVWKGYNPDRMETSRSNDGPGRP